MRYANVYAARRTNNSIFEAEDSLHKFNPTYFPRLLKKAFLDAGIEINTSDLNTGKMCSFDLYIEGQEIGVSSQPRFLLALENPYINSLNQDKNFCSQFTQVFTWDARLFGLPNVHPILIPHSLVKEEFSAFSERKIFSCLINANKAFKHTLPTDLYLERIETIRWYERNALDKFQLFGLGWNKSTPAFNFKNKLKRVVPMLGSKIFGIKPFPSFAGEVVDKAEVLRNAKFSYCYENSRDLDNYVTEKILDSLVCGCIPIYWGGSNITELIPSDCFIDRRNFKDTRAVHTHLMLINEDHYTQYQVNIANFLKSDAAQRFRAENVVSIIVNSVLDCIKTMN